MNIQKRRVLFSAGLIAILFCWSSDIRASDKAQEHRFGGLLPKEIIGADELRQKQLKKEPFLLLDARNQNSFKEAHIQGASLPLTREYYRQEELFRQGIVKALPASDKALAQNMSRYPKDTQIITYCNVHCQASAVLALNIMKLGFSSVKAMEDGFQTWETKGYPVEKMMQKKL